LANWDVFHADRLEVQRSLTAEAIRRGWTRGEIRDDDLIRRSGSNDPWARVADFPGLLEAEEAAAAAPFSSIRDLGESYDDEESVDAIPVEDDDVDEPPEPARNRGLRHGVDLGRQDLQFEEESLEALPVMATTDDVFEDEYDPQAEDDDAANFTFSRGGPEKVEELDLAAMVDVAFQLVLFFLVTATTVLYKSLEVPKPNPDNPAVDATQGRSKTLDELQNDFILVDIDAAGTMKIDREPVPARMDVLVERLRVAREKTGRKAMLLTADFVTPHRNAVLAYDAANEIGLSIAIARPSEPAPGSPPPVAKKAVGS
jgi:biopolymer transport protein ExbD